MKRPSDADLVRTIRTLLWVIDWHCRHSGLVLVAMDSKHIEDAKITADTLEKSAAEPFEKKVDKAIQAVLSQHNVGRVSRREAEEDPQFRNDVRVILRAVGVE